MNLDKLYSWLCRLFFFGALALFCLVVLEKIVNLSRYTLLRGYGGGRVLDLASVLLLFVIAILLREIREATIAKRT